MGRPRKRRISLALRWLAAALLGVIALAYVHPLRAYFQAKGEVQSRQAEVAALERQHSELARRLAVSESDDFIEQEARRLGLVRPGERLFIVKGLENRRLR